MTEAPPVSETAPARRLPLLTDRLPLGGDGLRVSPFCLGIVGDPDTVVAAFEAGMNFFFLTTDMHWPLYEGTRRGLEKLIATGGKGVRDRIVVAGVCYPTQPEFCTVPFDELVSAVPGLERLDVLLAGGAYGGEIDKRLPIYAAHREQRYLGARAMGATFHDRKAARVAVSERQLDIAYVRYNTHHAGAREEVFAQMPERPRPLLFNFKSTSGYVPPARMAELGLGSPDWWQPQVPDHYRFALTRPELDGLLIALRNRAEVSELAAAMERGPLTEEEEQYLMDVAAVARGEARVLPDG
jgi:hypothetical protein